jgi:hypothetical protein
MVLSVALAGKTVAVRSLVSPMATNSITCGVTLTATTATVFVDASGRVGLLQAFKARESPQIRPATVSENLVVMDCAGALSMSGGIVLPSAGLGSQTLGTLAVNV